VTGIHIKLPTELHRHVKAQAALEGKTLGEFINELLSQKVGR
jgi:predicted HicB family RNase H-like nuclease